MTEKQLTEYSKEAVISMYISLQEITESLRKTSDMQQEQMTALNKKIDLLLEQVALSNQRRFGRSSEKIPMDGQMELCFNEAEVVFDSFEPIIEPEFDDIYLKSVKRKKSKGKREADLKDLPVKVIYHEMTEEQLKKVFGDNWRRLPDEVYKRLAFHPATFEVEEHHVAVYCGTDNQTIIRASREKSLLRNRHDVKLSRQNMAHWTIQCSERYLSLLYDLMHKELMACPVIQADETPVEVSKDGRSAGSKSYMCYVTSDITCGFTVRENFITKSQWFYMSISKREKLNIQRTS